MSEATVSRDLKTGRRRLRRACDARLRRYAKQEWEARRRPKKSKTRRKLRMLKGGRR